MATNDLYVGKECEYEDIKVGEVFAFEGCWAIFYKEAENNCILLEHDNDGNHRPYLREQAIGKSYHVIREYPSGDMVRVGKNLLCEDSLAVVTASIKPFYKLPKSVQKLWLGKGC